MIRDPLTGEAALLGTTRSTRPDEYRAGREERCAFCPGNEELTPPEIARIGGNDYWTARAFRNKYPAIAPPHGDHEVIVDSREHTVSVTPDALRLWRARYAAALEWAPQSYPVLFKNAGPFAGATIVHPHAQMIVLPVRPDRWPLQPADLPCAICAEREASRERGLLVLENEVAAAFVRESSRFSWTLSIAPHACAPSLLESAEPEWLRVGELVAAAIEAMHAPGAEPSFNLLVYSDPHAQRGAFHWSIDVVPRTSTLAGFELSTGMFIRGATAQESAARWRRMIAPPDGSF